MFCNLTADRARNIVIGLTVSDIYVMIYFRILVELMHLFGEDE